jgi:SAM-dependent methyltransferase
MLAPPADLAAWNRRLNETHAMAAMRARAGLLVRAIEGRRRRLVARRVRAGPHARVVDVGCEDGWVAAGYAEGVERLTLVDLDPQVLARSPLRGRPGVSLLVADATDPAALRAGLGGDAPDVVVLSALLEHLPAPRRALAAVLGLLGARGRVVIYVPADRPILFAKGLLKRTGLWRLVRGLSLEPAPGHLHRFDRRRLARLLAPFGRILELTFDPLTVGYVAVLAVRRA